MKGWKILVALVIQLGCARGSHALGIAGTDQVGQPPTVKEGSIVVAADQATVESCRACHQGPLSLQGRAAEELLVRLRSIVEGRAAHPVVFPQMSEQELAAVAEALAMQ